MLGGVKDLIGRDTTMIRLDPTALDYMETRYPGIRQMIQHFDAAELPHCPQCESDDTADVQVDIIGRTINIAAATTKFHLIANGPRPGAYFCNACRSYFN